MPKNQHVVRLTFSASSEHSQHLREWLNLEHTGSEELPEAALEGLSARRGALFYIRAPNLEEPHLDILLPPFGNWLDLDDGVPVFVFLERHDFPVVVLPAPVEDHVAHVEIAGGEKSRRDAFR